MSERLRSRCRQSQQLAPHVAAAVYCALRLFVLRSCTPTICARLPPSTFRHAATSPVAGAVVLGEPRAAAAAAARRLGLHYLQRYFFLIAFR